MVRDHLGAVIIAFSSFYAAGTKTEAEAKALLEGLKLIAEHNIPINWIECDSLVLVNS